jgi:hypothetical protein
MALRDREKKQNGERQNSTAADGGNADSHWPLLRILSQKLEPRLKQTCRMFPRQPCVPAQRAHPN